MRIRYINNQKGSATIEAALVFPILLVLIMLFAVVIKTNVTRAVVNHSAVDKSVKECFGTTFNQIKADISNEEMKWTGIRRERVQTNVSGDILNVSASAQMNINLPMVGERTKLFESKIYVPVFNDVFGDNANGAGSSVWDLLPFDRGRVIESVFGNNLPDKFEVLDILTGEGLGVSIVSIDTTSATYANEQQLYNKVVEHINKISSFQGDEADDIRVGAEHVKQKKLIVIIPSNGLTDEQQRAFQEAENYAVGVRVEMEIVEYQEKAMG